jgi:hypothetical protein
MPTSPGYCSERKSPSIPPGSSIQVKNRRDNNTTKIEILNFIISPFRKYKIIHHFVKRVPNSKNKRKEKMLT